MSLISPVAPLAPTLRGGGKAKFTAGAGAPPVEWVVTERLVDYAEAVTEMDGRVARIAAGEAPERVWLLEHPPVYTAGTSAKGTDLMSARFPVYQTGRGGQYTYHGPGQRVVYTMLDLRRRHPDVRAFVAALEDWAIATLRRFNIAAERRQDRVGVWVRRPDKAGALDGSPAEDKIAALGIRLRHWVSFHGMSINVDPDLAHFDGIIPCGIGAAHLGVTSFVDLGHPVTLADVDTALRQEFERIFGSTVAVSG